MSACYRFLAFWLAPLLLVVVALVQQVVTHTAKLVPWRGGGYGMYATLDDVHRRRLQCQAIDERGNLVRVLLAFPTEQSRTRLRVMPRRSALERAAREVLNSEFVRVRDPVEDYVRRHQAAYWEQQLKIRDKQRMYLPTYRVRSSHDNVVDPDSALHVRAVQITVWRVQFDAQTVAYQWIQVDDPMQVGAWPEVP